MNGDDRNAVLIKATLFGYRVTYRPKPQYVRSLREARKRGAAMLDVDVEVYDRRATDGTETVDVRKNVTTGKGGRR